MNRSTIFALMLVTLSGSVQAQPDKQKLREAIKLPSMTFAFGVGFSAIPGQTAWAEESDPQAEIAALRKALKGNASDAERWQALGSLYERREEKSLSQAAFARAVSLYRQRVKAQPRQVPLLIAFGKTLQKASQQEEAERVFRQATQAAPKDWRPWVALGDVLGDRALSTLFGRKTNLSDMTHMWPVLMMGVALQKRDKAEPPPPEVMAQMSKLIKRENIARTQKFLAGARSCYDRAVTVVPGLAEPYLERAKGRVFVVGATRAFLHLMQGNFDSFKTEVLSPDNLDDLRQGIRLSRAPRALLTAVQMEIMISVANSGKETDWTNWTELDRQDIWDALSEKSQNSVNATLARLEKMAQARDKRGAEAGTALGCLCYFLRDTEKAETALRGAVERHPTFDPAWELRMGMLVEQERYEDMAALGEERLKHKDSTRNRLLLAKAYEKTEKYDKAEIHAQAAWKRRPNDFLANLMVAALMMKRGTDAATLARAGDRLARAGKTAKKAIPGESIPDTINRTRDYGLLRGIYLALNGDTEKARVQLKETLARAPEEESVQEALTALDE
jgi:tetratricopeptide (TPR) repeat protein